MAVDGSIVDPSGVGWVGVILVLADPIQIWSLTQFYSDDYSQSRISFKKYFFNKHKSRLVSWFRWCPRTNALSVAHLKLSLFLCSFGSID